MPGLRPVPFGRLVSRLLRELETGRGAFDLPRRSFFLGDPAKDFSVRVHGEPASSPLGPAAGPHTQLAQNIALAWLGGARVFELKTVQVNDALEIPRPCIDMRGPGYNVEWSQELRLCESLEEYVKASMLVDLLRSEAGLPLAPGFRDSVFDLSVGYDLAGLKSPGVTAFIEGMKDARPLVDRLRREIPEPWQRLRDLDFRTRISRTVTLSTFHGCPPGEIESMVDHLTGPMGLSATVKLNPTLLGGRELRRLLNEELGYSDIEVPDEAFEKDASWDQAARFTARLAARCAGRGKGFGVKFSNTLVVKNRGGYLPASEPVAYLSGRPLHVLAMHLVRRFRRELGDRLPVSFSAGIDRRNFPDAAALGLVPVTVCSDLLGPGGYGRLKGYYDELSRRMDEAGVRSLAELSRDRLGRTETYVEGLAGDPRYRRVSEAASPRKVGSSLALFDCLACDKCVSACPNDANFAYRLEPGEVEGGALRRENGRWLLGSGPKLRFAKEGQVANFADLCNECGNCDVFCPEEGGPFRKKPRFFGSFEAWRTDSAGGFYFERRGLHEILWGRLEGLEYRLAVSDGWAEYSGSGFHLRFRPESLEPTVQGEAQGPVDLAPYRILDRLRRGVAGPGAVNYVA